MKVLLETLVIIHGPLLHIVIIMPEALLDNLIRILQPACATRIISGAPFGTLIISTEAPLETVIIIPGAPLETLVNICEPLVFISGSHLESVVIIFFTRVPFAIKPSIFGFFEKCLHRGSLLVKVLLGCLSAGSTATLDPCWTAHKCSPSALPHNNLCQCLHSFCNWINTFSQKAFPARLPLSDGSWLY